MLPFLTSEVFIALSMERLRFVMLSLYVPYGLTTVLFIANCRCLCCCPGKNSSFLRVVRCRSLAEEYSVDSVNKDEISKLEINFLFDLN